MRYLILETLLSEYSMTEEDNGALTFAEFVAAEIGEEVTVKRFRRTRQGRAFVHRMAALIQKKSHHR